MYNNQRLDSPYNRYSDNSAQAYDNGKHNSPVVNTNRNDRQLSILQEPDIEYYENVSFLAISSQSRNIVSYPSPNKYTIELPREYKNVTKIELIDASIPDKNNITQEPYLVLQIDEINDVIDSVDPVLGSCFAILRIQPATVTGFFMSMDNCVWEKTPKIYKQPKASLSKFSISIKKSDGTLFDFLEPTELDPLYQHVLQFKITTSEVRRNTLQHRNI